MIFKSLIIALALISAYPVFAENSTINYNSTVPGNFCSSAVPSGVYQSPIALESTLCAPYSSFSLNLPNITGSLTPNKTYWNSILGYTTGTLEFNGVNYTSSAIGLHYQSENQLPLGQADMEMQIYFLNQPSGGGLTNMAVVSFLLVSTNSSTAPPGVNIARNTSLNTFGSFVTATQDSLPIYNFNLSLITNAIASKSSNYLYLNFYQYQGTPNYPVGPGVNCNVTWLVYGSEIAIDQSVVQAFEYTLSSLSNLQGSGFVLNQYQDGSGNDIFSNSLNPGFYNNGTTPIYTKLCYTGYFQVTLGSDPALWYSVFLTLLYFIVTLSMDEKPNKFHDFEQNHWTAHPIYSVLHVGNDIFTRKSRITSIYVTLINIYLWSSYLALNAYNSGSQGNVWLFALESLPISWVSSYIIGCFLRQYYKKKYDAEKDKSDDEDDRAQFYIYIYYFLCVLFFCVGFPLTIANLYGLNQNPAGSAILSQWGGSIFLAAAFEWLIFDTIITLLASKIEGLFSWVKTRGFVYDEVCHETYKLSIKKD